MSRVDHAGHAREFLRDEAHRQFHDQRLWELREKRDAQSRAVPEWERLREAASAIKTHTLSQLADYLEQFEAAARANGVTVHWARDGTEHNAIVHRLLAAAGVDTLVKSKSMLMEECELRPFLEARGITVMETDLGERIQQLDKQPPSHVVVPAVHKLRGDVSEVFHHTLGTEAGCEDVPTLARAQREHTRPFYARAQAGMTGANFLVAETGAVVVCTNEGNADLSANVPPLHIVSAGIEKLIPRQADLGLFVRLLSRSALGSPITQYTSHFRAPREGGAMHIVLVDNGRSTRLKQDRFWSSLKCIRCGACMNTCPVYRRSGGLSYGAVYPGPIGAVIDPTFNLHRYSQLPYASTLNGSCTQVCPVKINLHEQIYAWRQVIAEADELPPARRRLMRVLGRTLGDPARFRAAVRIGGALRRRLPRLLLYLPLNTWGRGRELPPMPKETFQEWYRRERGRDKP
ncbi:lactate utilization protein B [Oleiagrimonas sp. C23AA]|uniref:lactate utilization protein B n=1 Tax=Oleiagrimonas sp. C23AA TaxID=2719047 RepID=UPI0014200602|nr:lactate utilization protein B [Oleiagrimonas sp. C23AA]NII10638.1 lactate utilization protein [Oleiagrimonas sp. C23AA]